MTGSSTSMRRARTEIFTALRDGILTGALAPGEQLKLRDIAARHQVSVMPVREALVQLKSAGLITQVSNRGAFVARLTVAQLEDLYSTRRVVETGALALSAPKLNADHLQQMGDLLVRIDQRASSGDWPAVLDLDEQFLTTLYRQGASTSHIEIITTLWMRVRPYKYHLIRANPEAAHELLGSNRSLLQALRDHHFDRAEQILADDLDRAIVHLRAALEPPASDNA